MSTSSILVATQAMRGTSIAIAAARNGGYELQSSDDMRRDHQALLALVGLYNGSHLHTPTRECSRMLLYGKSQKKQVRKICGKEVVFAPEAQGSKGQMF